MLWETTSIAILTEERKRVKIHSYNCSENAQRYSSGGNRSVSNGRDSKSTAQPGGSEGCIGGESAEDVSGFPGGVSD